MGACISLCLTGFAMARQPLPEGAPPGSMIMIIMIIIIIIIIIMRLIIIAAKFVIMV